MFLTKYPQYASLDFHITGESYAGHYIPAIASHIVEANKAALPTKVHINLESIAIGNGWTDPLIQTEYYPDMALDTKYGPILDAGEIRTMKMHFQICKRLIIGCYRFNKPLICV